MARRRKEERRAGLASQGMCSAWVIAPPVGGYRSVSARGVVPERCHASGSAVDAAVTLPHGCDGLRAWRMALLWTFRELFLCRHVRCEFLRNALLNVTPGIPATACHQRNDVDTYSRSTRSPCSVHVCHFCISNINNTSRILYRFMLCSRASRCTSLSPHIRSRGPCTLALRINTSRLTRRLSKG